MIERETAYRNRSDDLARHGHLPNMGGQPVSRTDCPTCGRPIRVEEYTETDARTGQPFTTRNFLHA